MGGKFLMFPLLLAAALWGGWLHCPTSAKDYKDICRRLDFSVWIEGHALQGHVIKNLSLSAGLPIRSACKNQCILDPVCVSVNIGPIIKDRFICELSDSDHTRDYKDMKPREGFMYMGTENPCFSEPCFNDGTCLSGFTDKKYLCECQAGYTGEQCEKDIDECAIKTDNCSGACQVCKNTEGSFTCMISAYCAVFTNLNATGRLGPTTLGGQYTGQDHDGQVTLSSGIQQWTVPYTGEYRIEAIGAAGGYDKGPNSAQYRGRGARMIGTFSLSKDEIIKILVGHEGGINIRAHGSGGGGETFVVTGSNSSLVIAGGGGGINMAVSRHAGCDANTSTTGNPGYRSWSGGSNGHGAQTADHDTSGGGGGGFYSSGRSGTNFGGTMGSGGEGGKGFLQGGVGGRADRNNVVGGFGGGGGAHGAALGGGGGGGFSGGSSGNGGYDTCGGGGGSYNNGTNQHNDCCYNTAGHGQVTITLL